MNKKTNGMKALKERQNLARGEVPGIGTDKKETQPRMKLCLLIFGLFHPF